MDSSAGTCVRLKIDGTVITVATSDGDGGRAARYAMVASLLGCRRQFVAAIAGALPLLETRLPTASTAVSATAEEQQATADVMPAGFEEWDLVPIGGGMSC